MHRDKNPLDTVFELFPAQKMRVISAGVVHLEGVTSVLNDAWAVATGVSTILRIVGNDVPAPSYAESDSSDFSAIPLNPCTIEALVNLARYASDSLVRRIEGVAGVLIDQAVAAGGEK
ncbi:hypothetical protein PSP31120_01288 [Pandoraea sputorum]|nr:hypothetical protein PSP31120_01288 [Pandoraea sputorum]